MPFLGKSPSDGNHNVLLDAITTSATATYNLTKDSVAYTPVSAQSLMVSLNGVTQAPIAAYTVSGSTIVFASALTSNDVIDYIICFEGPKVNATLDANTVTTAMIQDNAITSAKIGVDVIVAEDLAANSITVSEITDGAVSTAKVADDAITLAKMDGDGSFDGKIITYDASGDPVHVGPGTDGQVLTSTGAGSPPAFETLTTGPTHINTWRTSADNAGTQDPITANWETDDTPGFVLLGSAMTVSSGIFTFPATGIWRIDANTTWSLSNTIIRYVQTAIKTTIDNGSNWKYGAIGSGNINGTTNVSYYAGAYCSNYFDVTNTSNCKVAIGAYADNSSTNLLGNTGYNYTYVIFVRVGDT